jgi:hypothetical protein
MELTYRLTRDDYRQFDKLARARMAPRKKQLLRWSGPAGAALLLALVSPALTIFVLEWLNRSGVIDLRASIAAVLAYAWGVWTVWLCGMLYRSRYRAGDGSPPGDLLLKADGDGLQVSGQARTEAYSWRAFTDISEHADYIILWLAPSHGIIVPVRAMAGEDMRRAFVDLARAHIALAATPMAPPLVPA